MRTLNEELHELRRLKDIAEAEGTEKKEADAVFKKQMEVCLHRMETEESDSSRTRGYLFTAVPDRMKGQVEDRKRYVRWALENDPGICEFLDRWTVDMHPKSFPNFEGDFYAAIMGTSVVKYKEDGTVINGQARAHVDDGAPLPPGLTFRPDPYIQMRKS